MNRRGDFWDNTPMESFSASLKKELVHHEDHATREQAKASSFEYIEAFHNRVRRHSALGYVAPAEYERTHNQHHRYTLSTIRGELRFQCERRGTLAGQVGHQPSGVVPQIGRPARVEVPLEPARLGRTRDRPHAPDLPSFDALR